MKRKIVADSSANLLTLEGIDFESTPLVIRTNDREFVDDENLDVEEMADYLKSFIVVAPYSLRIVELIIICVPVNKSINIKIIFFLFYVLMIDTSCFIPS